MTRIGISTRGSVQTRENVVIGGFIVSDGTIDADIILRGIGQSLAIFGLSSNPLVDSTLQLRNGDGDLLVANDDWRDDPDQGRADQRERHPAQR